MPVVRHVQASEVGRLLSEGDLARRRVIKRAIRDAMHESVAIVQDNMPEDLGTLKESTHVVEKRNGIGIQVDAPHAMPVEAGARPHWAPIRPLLEWASRKVDNLRDAWALAKGTQIKIAKEGSKPTWYMRRSLPAIRATVIRYTRQRLREYAQRAGR